MNVAAIMFIVAVAVLLLIFGPLLTIWSINTLFGLAIPFTLKTWVAALFLSGVVGGSKVNFKSSK